MKRKTIFNTLILTLMVFSSLFVANMSPYVSVSAIDHPVSVYKVSGNIYKDKNGDKYYKQYNGIGMASVYDYEGNLADENIVKKLIYDGSSITPYVDFMLNDLKYDASYNYEPIYTQAYWFYDQNKGSADMMNYLFEYSYYRYEPIYWEVVAYNSKTGKALIVSDNILANMAYQPTHTNDYTTANGGDGKTTYAYEYKYSNIRYWLNGYTQTGQTQINNSKYYFVFDDSTLGYPSLLTTAFTQSEKAKMSIVNNYGDLISLPDYNTYINGEAFVNSITGTTDYGDLIYYYFTRSNKMVTDFALAHCAAVEEKYEYGYGHWLMTCNEADGATYHVDYRVSGSDSGLSNGASNLDMLTNFFCSGVAPAMIVDISDMTLYKKLDVTNYGITSTVEEYGINKLQDVSISSGGVTGLFVQFGSYPQTFIYAVETIDIPAAGVSINTAGIVLSSTILIGLFVWMGFIANSAIKSKKRR